MELETRVASPSHFLLKIKSFSLLAINEIYEYESGVFDAGGHKWRLVICTNDNKTGRDIGEYISVYLAISDTTKSDRQPSNWEVNAVFSFFLLNQISGKYHYSLGITRRFQAMMPERGISKFISKKVLKNPSNGFLLYDSCVFGVEVFVVEKSAVYECLSLKDMNEPFKKSWNIYNYSKLGDVWTSPPFVVEGIEWEVCLYPKGDGHMIRGTDGWVAIYISLISPKRVKASYSIRIKSFWDLNSHIRNGSNWFSQNPSSRSWGGKFIALAAMENPWNYFILEDCCRLEVELSVEAVV